MTSVIKHRTELAIHIDVITVLRSTNISVYIAIYIHTTYMTNAIIFI